MGGGGGGGLCHLVLVSLPFGLLLSVLVVVIVVVVVILLWIVGGVVPGCSDDSHWSQYAITEKETSEYESVGAERK